MWKVMLWLLLTLEMYVPEDVLISVKSTHSVDEHFMSVTDILPWLNLLLWSLSAQSFPFLSQKKELMKLTLLIISVWD